MLVSSFTQTYGENRFLELMLLKYDVVGNAFRNKCDMIIFSFHNCSKEFVEAGTRIVTDIYPAEKLKILEYRNISYLETIRRTLDFLKEREFDYVLQIQDDQHGINSTETIHSLDDIDEMFSFLVKTKPALLNIFSNEGNPKYNGIKPLEKHKEINTTFYSYNTKEFQKKRLYAWNDGTYFARLDFLRGLFSMKLPTDVWGIEFSLKYFFDKNYLIRWGCDKLYFKASNLHGKNTNKLLTAEDNLKRFFGELDAWDEIKTLIPSKL